MNGSPHDDRFGRIFGEPQAKKAGKPKPAGVREGSKTEKVVDLLKRSGGATLGEILKATGWQPHSVRGFISGTLGKKMGLKAESATNDATERVYSIAQCAGTVFLPQDWRPGPVLK